MKRVSFAVAKAIKEAGYPQDIYNMEFYYAENGLIWVYDPETYETLDDAIYCVCPLVMDVWLWLWREKKKDIDITFSTDEGGWTFMQNPSPCDCGLYNDPEEAIEAAIKYLVDNDLIQ